MYDPIVAEREAQGRGVIFKQGEDGVFLGSRPETKEDGRRGEAQ